MKIRPVHFLIYFTAFFLISACHHHSEDFKKLEKAAAIHMEAVKLEAALKADLEELIQRKNSINIQGRALTEEEMQFVGKVEAIEASHQFWTDNHVEVPGFDHHDHGDGHGHHDHSHDHSHDHGAKLEVSADDMLLIQKEFKDSIVVIQQLIQALLK